MRIAIIQPQVLFGARTQKSHADQRAQALLRQALQGRYVPVSFIGLAMIHPGRGSTRLRVSAEENPEDGCLRIWLHRLPRKKDKTEENLWMTLRTRPPVSADVFYCTKMSEWEQRRRKIGEARARKLDKNIAVTARTILPLVQRLAAHMQSKGPILQRDTSTMGDGIRGLFADMPEIAAIFTDNAPDDLPPHFSRAVRRTPHL